MLQALLEGISLCQPQPKLPSELIKYLGKTFGAWHIAIPLLESHVFLFPEVCMHEHEHGRVLAIQEQAPPAMTCTPCVNGQIPQPPSALKCRKSGSCQTCTRICWCLMCLTSSPMWRSSCLHLLRLAAPSALVALYALHE